MTLSRIRLPSINSVLTSERVFLPGRFLSAKLDMDAAETKSLPNPDFLMKTIHLDEAPCVGHLVSSFDIGHSLDTIVEEGEPDAITMTNAQSSTSSGNSSSSNSIKHDSGLLSAALRILCSIKVIGSFTHRRSLKRARSRSS